MFSSRQVDWKRGTTAIACYYSMESLPKDMRGKVELDPATDSAMLYSSKTTIWPKNKELDLGKSSTRKEYALCYSGGLALEIRFRLTSPLSDLGCPERFNEDGAEGGWRPGGFEARRRFLYI